QGTMVVASHGTFTVDTGSDVRLTGAIDEQSIAAVDGATAAVPLEAGAHVVNMRLDLTGRNWRFIPRWNGADVFSAAATSTGTLNAATRFAQRAGRLVTPTLIVALLAAWFATAVAAL